MSSASLSTTMIVSSPATVPMTSGQSSQSIAVATAAAPDNSVRMTIRFSAPLGREEEDRKQVAERRLLFPGFGESVVGDPLGPGDLDEAELADVAGQCGLRDLDSPFAEQLPESVVAGDAV